MITLTSYSKLEGPYSESRNSIFLPIISRPAEPPPEPPERIAFAHLCSVKGQQHPSLIWDPCLELAAKIRVEQISIEWGHCFQGNCANRIVRAICPVPTDYPENGNSIESIIGGVKNPISALTALLGSNSHADHLLGRNEFFRSQNRVGIAFLDRVGSPYTFYYVFLISK